MDKVEYQVIIMESGEQIPVSSSPNVTTEGFYIGSDRPKRIVKLDVSAEEFAEIQEQAAENAIPEEILNQG